MEHMLSNGTEPGKAFGKHIEEHVAELDSESPLHVAPTTRLRSSRQVMGLFITLVSSKHKSLPP